MSYDLMVFETESAPKDHADFIAWYSQQTKWGEAHDYNDPALTSERLQAWFREIIRIFPPMHGRYSEEPSQGDVVSSSDYAIGADFIYASFAWSNSEVAYMTVARLAEKHQLGLFNANSSGEEVWVPAEGGLVLAHDKGHPTLIGRIKRLLDGR
ncbi:MAG TPA: hypothetical protein VKB47_08880 [Terracidiphilus sp.]|nr:hypothetical protein [Terracidiphilus sp.]